jgi:hypothetical protein
MGPQSCESIIAEFLGSRGATRQELDSQEPAPIAGKASPYIAATESGNLRYHLLCLLTLDRSVPQGHLIDNRCEHVRNLMCLGLHDAGITGTLPGGRRHKATGIILRFSTIFPSTEKDHDRPTGGLRSKSFGIVRIQGHHPAV